MQIAQLIALGLPIVAIKEFDQSTSVETSGSIENFLQTTMANKATVVFLKGKSVSDLMIEALQSNGRYGYTPDMTQNLLAAMMYLSALDTHKLNLSQTATDEIKELRRNNGKHVHTVIAEYQLAVSIDGVLIKSPTHRPAWIEYFLTHFSDIAAQEGKQRLSLMAKHNSHLKTNYVPVYAQIA